MSPQTKATFAASATGVLMGAAMVATKVVSLDVPPATLAFLRYLIGIAVFVVPLAYARQARFSFRDAISIAALGVLQFAVLMLLLNYALTKLTATTCALVFSTMPLFTMCFAIASGRERYAAAKLIGVSLALSGVVYLLSAPSAQIGSSADAWGLVALLAATLTGAATSILYGPYLARYPASPTCSLAMGSAVVFLAGFCWTTSQPLVPSLTFAQWANVGSIGLASGVGYFFWLWALANLDASRVVALQALAPVTAAAIELVAIRSMPSIAMIFSLAMVAAGLCLAIRRK